ncbi:Histone chaperone domain CHZ [Musa troglodytarum]|uniref:Histone chaperone domain CHZ n=1 Tax=Musa troglodytarum TaxID=320322 RepID=A0A9E7I8A0_9LILI|nr:Histone chaperone domain CHZ [Musa troglodytarum]
MEADLGAAKTKEEIEAEISRAMRARVSDFKERADTLTLEGVRRALEKDLGMNMFSLDAYKRFIKQCLEECFYGPDDDNVPKLSGMSTSQSVKEEKSRQSEDYQESADFRKSNSDEIEGSPASGGKSALNDETVNNQGPQDDSDINEDKIRKAIESRADYFRANSASISLAEVRRLLEEDLKLEKKALDAYKSFVTEELDKVLQIPEVVKAANGVKKQLKKVSQNVDVKKPGKNTKRARKESDSSDTNDSLTEDDEDIRPKKKINEKTKSVARAPKRQKKSQDKNESSSSSERKMEQASENTSEDDGGNSSADSPSHSSKGDVKKKQEKPTQVYGKRVEHLKSIIKSCGMGVPPSVYKRAKQVAESKREAYLIKELEGILKKEGLSINPSEKEMKVVRKKKERAKELEGIDMSNIVSSSRRRSSSSYIPPPKPKIEVDSDEDDEDEENEEDTDDDNEDDVSGSGEESDEGDEDESD